MAIRTLSTTLLRLGPLNRRLLLIAADALLLPLAVWLSFWLRLAHPFTPNFVEGLWLLPAVWLIGLPLYALSGQYKGLTRYVGSLAGLPESQFRFRFRRAEPRPAPAFL